MLSQKWKTSAIFLETLLLLPINLGKGCYTISKTIWGHYQEVRRIIHKRKMFPTANLANLPRGDTSASSPKGQAMKCIEILQNTPEPFFFFCKTLSLLVVTGSEAYFSHKVKNPKRLSRICWIKSYHLPMKFHFRYFMLQTCKIKKVIIYNLLLSLLITKVGFIFDRCWHYYCENLC